MKSYTFEEYVTVYCATYAHLCPGETEESVRKNWCDLAELRKSYDANEMPGDVAWNDYESMVS